MDFTKVLEQLRTELANLNAAILSLEKLQDETHPRRGRPRKSAAVAVRPSNRNPQEKSE